jgi:hypothetical protein
MEPSAFHIESVEAEFTLAPRGIRGSVTRTIVVPKVDPRTPPAGGNWRRIRFEMDVGIPMSEGDCVFTDPGRAAPARRAINRITL